MLTFIESSRFSTVRDNYFGGDDAFRSFQGALLLEPLRGDVIPGGGGTRKVRVPDVRRGKGKRGGLRVIYLYLPEHDLFAVYDKDEISDLTTTQKRLISAAAEAAKRELADSKRGQVK